LYNIKKLACWTCLECSRFWVRTLIIKLLLLLS